MKKLGFLVVLGLLLAQPVFAAVPDGTYFFQDGKGYDESGKQTFFCFSDGSCYTVEGVFTFTRELTAKVDELTNKVNQLQNTLNQIQQPVAAQPQVSVAPTPDLPAYTEKEIITKANQMVGDTLSQLVYANTYKPNEFGSNGKYGEKILSGTIAVISWNGYMGAENIEPRQHAKVLFNGQEILGAKNNPYYFNYPTNNGPTTEYLGMAFLENLQPQTTYSYQLVWSEEGRQNSVITKTFTTPAN